MASKPWLSDLAKAVLWGGLKKWPRKLVSQVFAEQVFAWPGLQNSSDTRELDAAFDPI
jgi:hypothetical protein